MLVEDHMLSAHPAGFTRALCPGFLFQCSTMHWECKLPNIQYSNVKTPVMMPPPLLADAECALEMCKYLIEKGILQY